MTTTCRRMLCRTVPHSPRRHAFGRCVHTVERGYHLRVRHAPRIPRVKACRRHAYRWVFSSVGREREWPAPTGPVQRRRSGRPDRLALAMARQNIRRPDAQQIPVVARADDEDERFELHVFRIWGPTPARCRPGRAPLTAMSATIPRLRKLVRDLATVDVGGCHGCIITLSDSRSRRHAASLSGPFLEAIDRLIREIDRAKG